MITTTYFDIETAPLPLAELEAIKPEFKAPANYKDLDKIKASLMEQEAKWLSDGALSATTGQVLVIGALVGGSAMGCYSNPTNESATLSAWWEFMRAELQSGNVFVGFCCKSFDLPFLIRRSWRYGIKVPACLFDGRYFTSQIIDLAEKWACGSHDQRDRISLDNLAKFLGVGAKNGNGKDFAALWQTDKDKALAYLRNDLELTKAIDERIKTF